MELLLKGVMIGTGATVLMDLWAVLLWKAFGQARPNWGPTYEDTVPGNPRSPDR